MFPPLLIIFVNAWGATNTTDHRILQASNPCGISAVKSVNNACCDKHTGHRRTQARVCTFPKTCSPSCAKQFIPFVSQCGEKMGVPDQFYRFYVQCDKVDGCSNEPMKHPRKLYAVGGNDASSHLNSAVVYDRKINSWSPIAPMGSKRDALGVAVLQR